MSNDSAPDKPMTIDEIADHIAKNFDAMTADGVCGMVGSYVHAKLMCSRYPTNSALGLRVASGVIELKEQLKHYGIRV